MRAHSMWEQVHFLRDFLCAEMSERKTVLSDVILLMKMSLGHFIAESAV